MDRPSYSPLPWQARAELFSHLAMAEKAGLPAQQAYAMLQLTGQAGQRAALMQRLIKRGTPPMHAAARAGLFDSVEQRILRAAHDGGQLETVYAQLADDYALRARTARQLRGRLLPILFVFAAALFIAPLPQLVHGQLTAAGYLGQALRPLVLAVLLVWLGFWLPHWLAQDGDGPVRAHLQAWQLDLPVLGAMQRRRAARDYTAALGLALDAGVPMFDALPLAASVLANPLLRDDVERMQPTVEAGLPLSSAAAGLRYFDTPRLVGMIQTGEASGMLSTMLLKFAADESDNVAADARFLADWMPRLAYALVSGWMIWSLVGGR
ncbi:type II secretion system F family protein [Massilia sp. TS11]|uniref:type II secretion system F family protein n=1 Tax=Massilia sp. TS11 TaxID=2908003 RepID=UPI001EDAFCF1|nr:type II secretion system F family protein [Massilia sp. TS11]MCG2584011.1 type II secretion system F family protein [Massilia sp. TS11]